MKLYATLWSTKVVSGWAKADPRVRKMIEAFEGMAAELKVKNPRGWVIDRLVFFVRTSSGTNTWNMLKKTVRSKISWGPFFREYMQPLHLRASYQDMDERDQMYLTFV